jgi:hypothetical protein
VKSIFPSETSLLEKLDMKHYFSCIERVAIVESCIIDNEWLDRFKHGLSLIHSSPFRVFRPRVIKQLDLQFLFSNVETQAIDESCATLQREARDLFSWESENRRIRAWNCLIRSSDSKAFPSTCMRGWKKPKEYTLKIQGSPDTTIDEGARNNDQLFAKRNEHSLFIY